MTDKFKVAGVQMDVTLGDRKGNLDRMEASLRRTAAEGAHLTVFPECALSGYCFESRAEALPHAEEIPGESSSRLSSLCQELKTHAVMGMLEKSADRLFNACVLIGPQGVIGSYRKAHLPYLGIDRFTDYGDRPFEVWDAGGLRIGMSICYDAGFPEASRVMALMGADLIVLPTNWPPGAECTAECVVNARALENNVYFLAVNRVGDERGFHFIGQSRMCAPDGSTVSHLKHDREGTVWGEVDAAWARRKKIIRVPGKHEIHRFNDRRPDLYGKLTEPLKERPR